MAKTCVIGTTSWGTTIAIMLARHGMEVSLWARTEDEAAHLRGKGPDKHIVGNAVFPSSLSVTSSVEEAVSSSDIVVMAVPSQTMRQNIKLVKPYLNAHKLIVSAAKGLEMGTNKRMSQVIADEIAQTYHKNICVLSGPNLFREILDGLPAAAVVAAQSETTVIKAQKIFSGPNLAVYINHDTIGVELGGTLKNIIALGAGMIDGLGYGDNAKAAFITRGLTEMTAFSVALGASPLTMSGLAGMGDLVATCSSNLSRNHYVGTELTKGKKLDEILASMTGMAEGVTTTAVVWTQAQKLMLEMPITEKIYLILYENASIRDVIPEILGTTCRHELTGRRWKLFRRKPR
ncbi:MAG: NAD(P)-dependent glycerol-3-phosphate dehydrogenase [Dehalococcoidia bacterium]|nr:NAD(P)-dependent glycerol-3-phosphate dehydrogenase [Dehalococcoidia bacterium]